MYRAQLSVKNTLFVVAVFPETPAIGVMPKPL